MAKSNDKTHQTNGQQLSNWKWKWNYDWLKITNAWKSYLYYKYMVRLKSY